MDKTIIDETDFKLTTRGAAIDKMTKYGWTYR